MKKGNLSRLIIPMLLFAFLISCSGSKKHYITAIASTDTGYNIDDNIKTFSMEFGNNRGFSMKEEETLKKNALPLVEKELITLGWVPENMSNSDYIIKIEFSKAFYSVDGDIKSVSKANSDNMGIKSNNRYTFKSISMTINILEDSIPIWSGRCSCSDADNNTAIKIIIPFLLSKFPESGKWSMSL